MVQIKKTSDKKYAYAKILILGEAGVGKTYFLGSVPDNEILVLNIVSESGMMTLNGRDIDVIDIDGIDDMKQAIEWIKLNGSKYSYIGIDSLSQWQKNLDVELPEEKHTWAKWQKIARITKDIVDQLKALPFHIVCTSEVKKEKEDDLGSYKYLPALLGSSKNEIDHWFDFVWYFDRYQQNLNSPISYRCLLRAAVKFPCKTRGEVDLPDKIENPNLQELTSAIFGKVNKEEQAAELKTFNTKQPLIDKFKKLYDTKDFDRVKFKEHYKTDDPSLMTENDLTMIIFTLEKKKDLKVGK